MTDGDYEPIPFDEALRRMVLRQPPEPPACAVESEPAEDADEELPETDDQDADE